MASWLRISGAIPHFAAWLKQAFYTTFAFADWEHTRWPLWQPRNYCTQTAGQREPLRHIGVIPYTTGGVLEGASWEDWNPSPYDVSPRPSGAYPVTVPAPADEDAGWLIEPVRYSARAPRVPYLNDPNIGPVISHYGEYDGNDRAIGGGYFPELDNNGPCLVKEGTTGITARRQSSQVCYLYREPGTFYAVQKTWTFNDDDPEDPYWTATIDAICEASQGTSTTTLGYLYAPLITPETGREDSRGIVAECQFTSVSTDPEGFAGDVTVWDVTWPLGVRAFRTWVLPTSTPGDGNTYTHKAVILWRAASATPTLCNSDNTDTFWPGTQPPPDAAIATRGPMLASIGDLYAGILAAATAEAATAGWRILGTAPASGDSAGSDVTIVDPPAGREEVIVVGVTKRTITGTTSGVVILPLQMSMWPEASVLPYALSVMGGGAIAGGTS